MIARPPRSTRTDTLFPTRRSSDLDAIQIGRQAGRRLRGRNMTRNWSKRPCETGFEHREGRLYAEELDLGMIAARLDTPFYCYRSEEHTSELQSLLRISYAVFCLKKKKPPQNTVEHHYINKL